MFKKIIEKSCIYFTVLTGVYASLMLIFYGFEEGHAQMWALRVFLMMPFSFCFGAATVQLSEAKYQKAYRRICHALLTVGGAVLFLLIPAGLTGAQNLTGAVIIIIAYVFIVAIKSLLGKRISKALEEDKKYRK